MKSGWQSSAILTDGRKQCCKNKSWYCSWHWSAWSPSVHCRRLQ